MTWERPVTGLLGAPLRQSSALPRVHCAVCRREVDQVIGFRDELRSEMVLIVRCHGDEERAVLQDAIFASAGTIQIGEAFASKVKGELPP